jgi:ABC-type dipeptide/oligopeptide/nickel transport system permease component
MYYIGKRLGITLLTLLLVSLLTFVCFHIIPGDAALLALGTDATEEQVEAMRVELGLDKALPVQYASWLGAFLTGNLGNSSRFRGESISGMVSERLPVTFHLALISLILILAIALPASFIGIKKENSLLDRLVNTFTAINISMPNFFLGVLLIWIFGLSFKLFTPGSYID